jgi:hypothetical protein
MHVGLKLEAKQYREGIVGRPKTVSVQVHLFVRRRFDCVCLGVGVERAQGLDSAWKPTG